MNQSEIFNFLNEKAELYNSPDFIENDPIQIPHRFSIKQDIEISAFLTATISWGNRKSIIHDAKKMLNLMEDNPYDFVLHADHKTLTSLHNLTIHRTFNGEDLAFFISALQQLYKSYDSLEELFLVGEEEHNFYHALERFRTAFFQNNHHRSQKHISSTYKNSAAKRLMMFLRWMVRKDKKGVDFGIWKNIDQKYLSIPLDVHTGNMTRKLGLLTRKQNDWKSVEELDKILRKYNPEDPAIYDFALFGLGIDKEF